MELRMRFAATADGLRIAYGTAGEGAPLLRIPTPPYSYSQIEWRQGAFFDDLCRNRMVVTFDPRGTGMSSRNVNDYSLEARMRDIDAVVSAAGITACAIHGIWQAGPLAIAYTARHPELVHHLVLDDTFANGRAFAETPSQRALRALEDDWDALLEHTVHTYVGKTDPGEAREYVEFMRQCVQPDDAKRMFRAFDVENTTDLLPDIKAPTLIVQHRGMRPQVGFGAAQDMAALIPNAQLLLLDGKESDDLLTFLDALTIFLGDPPVSRAAARTSAAVQTVLFTDLVDHTQMMHRLGDTEGRRVLREHEQITRREIERCGGEALKNTGDGFMAAFDSVAAATECAIALQRAFDERNASEEERLGVRVGLNAGEPIAEDGDLWGSSVILAARVAAQASAGEILVPEPVRHLLAGKGFVFADRGQFMPKGFEDAVRLFEVRWRE
jgi:class 3 adenylate cyclase